MLLLMPLMTFMNHDALVNGVSDPCAALNALISYSGGMVTFSMLWWMALVSLLCPSSPLGYFIGLCTVAG